MSTNYKINGISVTDIIDNTTNDSSNNSYDDFPVTSDSINYRDGDTSGNWQNSYGNEGQATYKNINFPYTFGNNGNTDMSQYCIGYKQVFDRSNNPGNGNINTKIGNSENSNIQFKHISILASGGAGGGAGGGGGGGDGFNTKSGGKGGDGGLPGIISVVDYPIPTNVSNISYTIGAGGTGGDGGNGSSNKSGDNGNPGNDGGTTNITIGNKPFDASGGPGCNAQGGSGNKSSNGSSHNNMQSNSSNTRQGGSGVYYNQNAINTSEQITYYNNSISNDDNLILNAFSPGNNMYDTNTNICKIGDYEYSEFGQQYDVPYNSTYLTPGLGGGGQKGKGKGKPGEDGATGQIQIWLKYDYNTT